MGLFDGIVKGFRDGRDAGLAGYAERQPPPPKDQPPPSEGEPSPIKIGHYHDESADEIRDPLLYFGERHVLIFGLNGAGKSTRLLIELLMTATNRSLVVFDIKGELAYQTADERRRHSDVKIINPFEVLGMPSDGYNPLSALDPKSKRFYDAAAAIGDALIEIESGSGQYWTESAQGLLVALIMFEVMTARTEGRAPSLFNVRMLLTEADEHEDYTDDKGRSRRRLVKGLSLTAARMIASGNAAIASLAGRFVRDHGKNELSSIQSTASTQTEWMLSELMKVDLAKQGTDLRQLRQRPTTIYIVMDPEEITRKRRWTRVVIASALSVHFTPGPMTTLFVLDEFRAAIGKMSIISDVWSLVRGYGVQLMPILQSAVQLQTLFKEEWENYAGQTGVVATLGPVNDSVTAEWLSKRSGVTTILQMGFSLNDGVSDSANTNAGSGSGAHGTTNNQGQGSGFGHNTGGGLSFQQAERRFLLPQQLMDLQNGHGRIWVPGMGSESIPFFAPPYWKRRAPWVARVKPNPYHRGRT
jgi:type IV secretion system protein VirD4